VEYMVFPESEVPPWMPLLGFTLICLPWAFWLLTFLYRVLSRCCGCRFGFGGGCGGDGGRDGASAPRDANVEANNNGINRTLSLASHQSQMPLAKSMA